MTAYYNEIDPYAAQWLRNLIDAGHIAPGVVDTRSIEDVIPNELTGFTQCHFFAGMGVWSYALRRAGWPDDRPVWTGSCPCQPFSSAGQGGGFADERHLWPAFFHLIEQCRPPVVFGEQVASRDANAWIDLVQDDLEGVGYGVGAVPFPSAGVGAPHIRDRLYWMAHSDEGRRGRRPLDGQRKRNWAPAGWIQNSGNPAWSSTVCRLADSDQHGCPALPLDRGHNAEHHSEPCGEPGRVGNTSSSSTARDDGRQPSDGPSGPSATGSMGDSQRSGLALGRRIARIPCGASGADAGQAIERAGIHPPAQPGPVNGHWSASDWLLCRDGKWRPVEASPQPLADGSSESLGRVRPEVIAEIEKEINASPMEREICSVEVLRELRRSLGAQAPRIWAPGRLPGLHEAPFLLAFLRQLTEQGWGVEKGVSLPCEETSREPMRSVRSDIGSASPSCERGLEGQPTRELTDAVHFLSSLLARHAHSAWADAHAAYAEVGFPIGHNSPSRMGRLRAYGNAINAEAARVFIEACM